MVVFQSRSGATEVLGSVAYYYVPFVRYLMLPRCIPLDAVYPHPLQQPVAPLGSYIHLDITHISHFLTLMKSVAPWGYRWHWPSRTSKEASTSIDLKTSSGASCCNHRLLCYLPPLNPFSFAQTSTIGHRATYCYSVPCLWKVYVVALCIPYDLNTSPAAGVVHILSEIWV